MGNLIKGVHHIALKARGLEEFEKLVHFYRDILQMEPACSWGEGLDSAIMLYNGNSRMELFANGTDNPGQGAIRHFALATDDVDACVAAVRAEGYQITVEPKNVVLAGNPVRLAFCIGPVGEEVEFFAEN